MASLYTVKTEPKLKEISIMGQRIIMAAPIDLPPNYRELEAVILEIARKNPWVEVGGWLATDGFMIQELYHALGDEERVMLPLLPLQNLEDMRLSVMYSLVEYHSHINSRLRPSEGDIEGMLSTDYEAVKFLLGTGHTFPLFSTICSPHGGFEWVERRIYLRQ